MDNFLNLLKHPLDSHQSKALKVTQNAVIAAGAGSGKTQVLATRFAWLVMTEQAKVSEILTLTFTNKAAAEMYQRIYETLSMYANKQPDKDITEKQIQLARNALEDFSNSHIQTLDSYCSSIVRQCANRYGIKPDFSVGSADSERTIKDEAFVYILQNSDNEAIKNFVNPGKIQDFSENTFAQIIQKHTSLATEPQFFEHKLEVQLETIIEKWNSLIVGKEEGSIYKYIEAVDDEVKCCEKKQKPEKVFYLKLVNELISMGYELATFPKITQQDILDKTELYNLCIQKLQNLLNQISIIPTKRGYITPIRASINPLKENKIYPSILKFITQYDAIKALDLLLDDFLQKINKSKRVSGNLTFNDVSELSLKILLENEDIRNQEKNAYKKIMIDEFQDNNCKNRDLLYVLSLKPGEFENNGECIIKTEKNQSLHELIKNKRSPEKLFFVGDEKQSIYKFRGAEVSVFNELTKNQENILIPMTYNYRSDKELVKAFNVIFKNGNGIFDSYTSEKDKIDFEAYYDKDAEKKDVELPQLTAQNIRIHACTLYKDEVDEKNSNHLSNKDQLCYDMAKRIYEMGKESKNWSSFAILDRSRTDRNLITKYLNIFGIPYSVDQQKNIFSDGIINDFYNFLRICVYPSDINAYAGYLCSPLCGLNENSVEMILSYLNGEKSTNYDFVFNPFEDYCEEIKNDLSENQYEKYINAQNFYNSYRNQILSQKLTTTLSTLWNTNGYKYETLLNHQTALFEEHFDMLFELARQAEENGKTVSWFIDQLDLLKSSFGSSDSDLDAAGISYPIERSQAVQIMSIHKSKGLQFDHVFIYGCTDIKSSSDKTSFYFFDEKYGVSVKSEIGGSNYFVLQQEEESARKALAEFRRLIYVAITRAVKDVFIMCKYNITKKESKSIFNLFENMIIKYYPYNSDGNYTFDSNAGFDYIPITPVSYGEVYHNLGNGKTTDEIRAEKINELNEYYKKAQEINYVCNPIPRSTPSSLEKNYDTFSAQDSDTAQKYEDAEDTLYDAAFSPADFGTLVHSYLEKQANGINPEEYIPEPKLFKNLSEKEIEENKNICIKMCKEFKTSEKGIELEKTKQNNDFYRAEWGFRMFHEGTIFTGSIDLIYSTQKDEYTIVDYKSDSAIDTEKYIEQQKCYRIAASKLLKVPQENIKLYLYFLRFGKTIEL